MHFCKYFSIFILGFLHKTFDHMAIILNKATFVWSLTWKVKVVLIGINLRITITAMLIVDVQPVLSAALVHLATCVKALTGRAQCAIQRSEIDNYESL